MFASLSGRYSELRGKPLWRHLRLLLVVYLSILNDHSIVWTAQFLMASQQKLLNADRLQTVLFSTRFVTWERENEFAIFYVLWISFSAWSTDKKQNRWKLKNKKVMSNTLFETWFDSFQREERSRYDTFLLQILNVTKPHYGALTNWSINPPHSRNRLHIWLPLQFQTRVPFYSFYGC